MPWRSNDRSNDSIGRSRGSIYRASGHLDLKVAAERIEFFNFDPPAEIRAYTQNTWQAVPAGYRLGLPEGEWISIEPNLLDAWDIRLSSVRQSSVLLLSRATSLAAAVASADRFVVLHRPDARRLVERSAHWRNELPSDKQKQVLALNRIPVPQGLTRGQAAQMISQLVSAHRAPANTQTTNAPANNQDLKSRSRARETYHSKS